MKPFVINRDAWHYKLNMNFANPNNRSWESDHRNFCDYWRATMGRLVVIGLLVSFAAFVTFIIVLMIIENPVEFATTFGTVVLGITLAFGIILGVTWIVESRRRAAYLRSQENPEPRS